jgi:drug/metabolite transporter (DMT)-like permease
MFFLILSCLLYAFNNLIWKKLLSIFNTWLVLVFRALLTSLLALAVALFFYSESLYELQEFAYGRVFLASIFGAFGLICMVLALKRGSLFQLGIFNLMIVLLTATYLLVFENIVHKNYFPAAILIVTGFTCYNIQTKKTNSTKLSKTQFLLFSTMAVFFAASALIHWKNLQQSTPAIISVMIQEFVVFALVALLILAKPRLLPKKTIGPQLRAMAPYVVFMAVIIFSAVWLGFIGLQSTNPLISALIGLITPIATILLGIFIYKDQCTTLTLGASLFIIVGVYWLNLSL